MLELIFPLLVLGIGLGFRGSFSRHLVLEVMVDLVFALASIPPEMEWYGQKCPTSHEEVTSSIHTEEVRRE